VQAQLISREAQLSFWPVALLIPEAVHVALHRALYDHPTAPIDPPLSLVFLSLTIGCQWSSLTSRWINTAAAFLVSASATSPQIELIHVSPAAPPPPINTLPPPRLIPTANTQNCPRKRAYRALESLPPPSASATNSTTTKGPQARPLPSFFLSLNSAPSGPFILRRYARERAPRCPLNLTGATRTPAARRRRQRMRPTPLRPPSSSSSCAASLL
jgi:hypothetical protein